MLRASWGGRQFDIVVREAVARAPLEVVPEPGRYVRSVESSHARAFVSPSSLEGEGVECGRVRLGTALPVPGDVEANVLGTALHDFFASDDSARARMQREEAARSILSAAGLDRVVGASDVVEASDRLQRWASIRWPDARLHRELPVRMTLPSGSEMRGACDLVVETSAGFAVVDHKVFLGGDDRVASQTVGAYAQLRAYAEMLSTALAKPCFGLFVHLALRGEIVELGPPTASTRRLGQT
jgi:ATP-dependent helicase/nuclease subunit A